MRRSNHSSWMGLSMLWISHLLMDFMIGVWPIYKTLVKLDLIVAGLIASLGMFIGEGLQLFFGYLSDKGYQQKLLALGIGLTVTIPFLSYVESMWLLFAMTLSACVGSSAFHPSGSLIAMAGNPSRQSLLIALFACGGMVGASLSQIGYVYLYEKFAGHLWFLALPIVVCSLGCAFFSFPKVEKQEKKANFRQVLQVLQSHKFKLTLLYVIHVLLQIVALSFTFLLPEILLIKGYEKWFCLGGGYFCYIMGSVVTSIPIGHCVDKKGYRVVLAAIVVASALLIYSFLWVESLSLSLPILLLLLLGGTMGVIIPVVVAGGIQDVPPSTRSLISALYMGGTACVAAVGPFLASILASFFEDQGAITVVQGLSSLLILALILIYYLPETLPQQVPRLALSSNGDQ
jgi:FSR family fosmidomycin resistance protein-like MFS transporter